MGRCQTIEAAVAIAQIKIVGIRLPYISANEMSLMSNTLVATRANCSFASIHLGASCDEAQGEFHMSRNTHLLRGIVAGLAGGFGVLGSTHGVRQRRRSGA